MVIPKALRDELGIRPGQSLQVSVRDGRLAVEHLPVEADLLDVGGVSAEEEHRQILRAALRSEGLGEYLLSIPDVGDDDDFARPREFPRNVDW